jgi:uncharacterized membrane protein YbhN (UPF0104 family)
MALPRWKPLAITVLRWSVALVVLWAVSHHVLRTWNDLRESGLSPHVEPGWLVGSGILYLAGLAAYGCFFERVLQASATPVQLVPTLRAYLISHLAKYVPGKAMVVVVRAALVVPFGARASTAAIATFYETLVMMATGGLVAAVGFAVAGPSQAVEIPAPGWGVIRLEVYPLSALLGISLGLAFLLLVIPPVFTRFTRLVTLPMPTLGPDAIPHLTTGLLVRGLGWSSLGWILLGLSLLAVVRAFDRSATPALFALDTAPVAIGGVALATVAGFVVAVLPGGLGVREGVLMWALAPALGRDQSVVAALALRLVWVAAELIAAVFLLPVSRPQRIEANPPFQPGTNPP